MSKRGLCMALCGLGLLSLIGLYITELLRR